MNKNKDQRYCSGFSLVEIAVVLVIIGLLLGGGLVSMAQMMQNANISQTDKRLADIEEALYGFLLTYGRLPCADIDGDGTENREATGVCTDLEGTYQSGGTFDTNAWDPETTAIPTDADFGTSVGFLPNADLGVVGVDAWNRRFSYRVSAIFADNDENWTVAEKTYSRTDSEKTNCDATPATTPASSSSFSSCTSGNIQAWYDNDKDGEAFYDMICSGTPTERAGNAGSDLVAVVWSGGKEAFEEDLDNDGTKDTVRTTINTSNDEVENQDLHSQDNCCYKEDTGCDIDDNEPNFFHHISRGFSGGFDANNDWRFGMCQ